MRRRHTIVSNTQAAPVRGRSERSGRGRSRGPVGGTFWSRGRPSGAICAGADAAALGRACRLRLPWRCRSCFSFPFLSLVFSGWFTWWVNGGGKKGWRGALPSYPSPSPPIGPREAIHLSHRSPRPALCSARSRERGRECEPAPAGPAFTRGPPILPRFQPPNPLLTFIFALREVLLFRFEPYALVTARSFRSLGPSYTLYFGRENP